MSQAHDEMVAALEAILFVATEPLPRGRLLEVFAVDPEGANHALETVIARYQQTETSGVMIEEVAGGLRLVTRPELHSHLRRFFELSGTNRLTMAALETLAIIAYRQPVTGPEIQELRSVNPSGVLKKLLERRLIRIAGRKEVVGKPFLYATTREFLIHFGLRSLRELPTLEQFEELVGVEGENSASSESGVSSELDAELAGQVALFTEHDAEEAVAAEQREIEAERAEAELAEAESDAEPVAALVSLSEDELKLEDGEAVTVDPAESVQ